jgi:hypothetical protein
MTSATYSALLRRGVAALNTDAADATEDDADTGDTGAGANADMNAKTDDDDGDVVVMLDATFRRPAERREAMAAASAANARLVFVSFKANDAVLMQRLRRRDAGDRDVGKVSDAGVTEFDAIKSLTRARLDF